MKANLKLIIILTFHHCFFFCFIIILWKLSFISPFFYMLVLLNINQITTFYNNQSIYHKPSSIVCNDGDKIQSHFKSPIMVVREEWIYPQVLWGYLSFLNSFCIMNLIRFISTDNLLFLFKISIVIIIKLL